MRFSDLIYNQYMYDDFTTWELVKIPKRERVRINEEIDRFSKEFSIRVPIDLRSYILCFWKEEICFFDDEDEEYNFIGTRRGSELDEIIRDVSYFRKYGGDIRMIPVGHDSCGELVLINEIDGSVWLLDTDVDEYRRLGDSFYTFLYKMRSREVI